MIVDPYKPSWKNAPSTANFLAQDPDGRWYWYSKEPKESMDGWDSDKSTFAGISSPHSNWTESLEKKPE